MLALIDHDNSKLLSLAGDADAAEITDELLGIPQGCCCGLYRVETLEQLYTLIYDSNPAWNQK